MSLATTIDPGKTLAIVAELVRTFKRGDEVSREWFEAAFGCDAEQDTWSFLNMLGRVKPLLLQHHRMDLVSAGGFAQRIVPANEQVDTALGDYVRTASRARHQLQARMTYVAEDQLTAPEKQRVYDNRARIAEFLELTDGQTERLVRACLPPAAEDDDAAE